MESLERVGRVSKPFGRQGELLINLYDTFPENFDIGEPLFAEMDSLTVPLFLDRFERRGRSGALVKFADFDTDSRAGELLGKELFIRTIDKGEQDGEVYFEDLAGFSVSFDDNPAKGRIVAYIDHDFNPLFELYIDGKQVYVPAMEEMITALDMDREEVEFSLPAGLLDLYL